jgi:hypothetical protein
MKTTPEQKLFSYLSDFFRQNDCTMTFEAEQELRAEIRKCADAVRDTATTTERKQQQQRTLRAAADRAQSRREAY